MTADLESQIEQTADGIWVIRGDSHLSKWVSLHHRLDIGEQEIRLFSQYIPVGATVVDAGASLGDHTLTYAKMVGPAGHVFAFEPHPAAVICLGRNLREYPWVHVRRKALGDESGYAEFKKEDNAGASHILRVNGSVKLSKSYETVRIRKLDRYLPLFERCDLLHLDCEGAEPKVLDGATALLAKFRPVIVLEVNHSALARLGLAEKDVHATLTRHGYSWRELDPATNASCEQRNLLATPL